MQKFSVATSKGFIHTTDFKSAMKILQMEMERKREEIKKESSQRTKADWDKEFKAMYEQYIPDNPQEAIQKKYEGGEE